MPTAGAEAAVRRGDVVTVALQGDLGKPRPAVVIQSDWFAAHPSVVVLPVTSDLRDAPLFRLRLLPSPANGLQVASDVMVDKPQTVSRARIGPAIGRLAPAQVLEVNRALALFIGLA